MFSRIASTRRGIQGPAAASRRAITETSLDFCPYRFRSKNERRGKENSAPILAAQLDELGQFPHHTAPAGTMRWKGFALGERDSPLGVGRCTECRGRVPDVVIPSGYRSPLSGGKCITDSGRRHCIHKQTSPFIVSFNGTWGDSAE